MKVLLFVGTVGAETKWRVEPCSALRREALLRRPVDVRASGFEFRPMVPWKLVECENAAEGRDIIATGLVLSGRGILASGGKR